MKNVITLQLVFNLAITLQGFHLIAFKIDRLHIYVNQFLFLSLLFSQKRRKLWFAPLLLEYACFSFFPVLRKLTKV